MTTGTKNEVKKRIHTFLAQHPLAVISTVNLETLQPESALVAFTQTENLELIFQTQDDTKKFKNLEKNNKVAFVTGWEVENHISLQSEKEKYLEIFRAKKTPCDDEFLLHPKSVLYLVTPTWIRLSDYSGEYPNIVEYGTTSAANCAICSA